MVEKKCVLSLAWCESIREITQRCLPGFHSSFPPVPGLSVICPSPYGNNSPNSLEPIVFPEHHTQVFIRPWIPFLGCPQTPQSEGSKPELIVALNLLQDHLACLSNWHTVAEARCFLDMLLSLLPPDQ